MIRQVVAIGQSDKILKMHWYDPANCTQRNTSMNLGFHKRQNKKMIVKSEVEIH